MSKRKADADETELRALATEYVAWDTNAETRAVIQSWIDAGDYAALRKALSSRLTFGTAGLRGPMEAGYAASASLVLKPASHAHAQVYDITARERVIFPRSIPDRSQ